MFNQKRRKMERGVKLFITLFLQFITLSLANQNRVPVFISEMGAFLRYSQIENFMEESVFDCVQRCVVTFNCKSINYKRHSAGNNCFLNSKNRRESGEAAMHYNDNFIYYDIQYHTQRSEEADFGTANMHVPSVPAPAPCDSNPCLNGGTCVEIISENRFKCNCSNEFIGEKCEQPKRNGNDFELVYRTANIANYVKYEFINKYVNAITVCAWIYTPNIAVGQKMAVWSIKTPQATRRVLRAVIDGEGGFYFNWGDQWSEHQNRFSESPKSDWVYLCVIFKLVNDASTVEAIVNANYSSKLSSTSITTPFRNVKLTRLIIGQELRSHETDFNEGCSFEGRIAGLNIWGWSLDEYHVSKWYRGTGQDEPSFLPDLLAWNTLGDPDKRFGDVHFVSVTSAFFGRAWRVVQRSDLVIDKTSNVMVDTYNALDGTLGVNITLQHSSLCADINTAPADAVFIAVRGNWARIRFKQIFMETQQCYAIFGSVPSWAPPNFLDPGIEEFDPRQDEIWKEKYLGGVDVDQYSGVNTLCGKEHFWAVNNMREGHAKVGIDLRRKDSATNAGISTYGKCGKFNFHIRHIRVLEIR